jgi:hypothetical protein
VWKDICLFLLIFRILRQTSVRAGPRLNRHEIFPEAFGACAEFLADKPEVMQVLPAPNTGHLERNHFAHGSTSL